MAAGSQAQAAGGRRWAGKPRTNGDGTRVSATEARIHFGELMRRVSSTQETVIVERSGQPQVVILSIAHYKRLITTQESSRWQQQLRELHDRIQEETARHEFPDASGVIRQMREERDDQLLDLR